MSLCANATKRLKAQISKVIPRLQALEEEFIGPSFYHPLRMIALRHNAQPTSTPP